MLILQSPSLGRGVTLGLLLDDGELNALALGQRDKRLVALANDKHVGCTRGEAVAGGLSGGTAVGHSSQQQQGPVSRSPATWQPFVGIMSCTFS